MNCLTVMVSTVLVLLLTVCVETISPSAGIPSPPSPPKGKRLCSTFGPDGICEPVSSDTP